MDTIDELNHLAMRAKKDGDVQSALAAIRKSFRIAGKKSFISANVLEKHTSKKGERNAEGI